jgi:hypothetical protein
MRYAWGAPRAKYLARNKREYWQTEPDAVQGGECEHCKWAGLMQQCAGYGSQKNYMVGYVRYRSKADLPTNQSFSWTTAPFKAPA